MLLVGAMVHGAEWGLDSYARIFQSLATEVPHTGEITRFVGYEGVHNGTVCVRFLGIEVERLGEIPSEMVAWELGSDSLTIHEPDRSQSHPLFWQWQSVSECGRVTGEFTSTLDEPYEFRMTANAYLAPGKEPANDDVLLQEYDSGWQQQFLEVEHWIEEDIGSDIALRIEHYGSTAIPGMSAKPIIDVLVEVPSFDLARRHIIPLLNSPEWEYWWYSESLLFVKRSEFLGPRTLHLHAAPAENDVWSGVLFRDYLRSHPSDAAEYQALKEVLVERFRSDRERYTEAKAGFVRKTLAKAGTGAESEDSAP